MDFSPGKISRRRGAVPGVAQITTAFPGQADALCAALPSAAPLLLAMLRGEPPNTTAETAAGAFPALPVQPTGDTTPAPPPPGEARGGEYSEGEALVACRAIFGSTFKAAQPTQRRDKVEGTIGSDPDFLVRGHRPPLSYLGPTFPIGADSRHLRLLVFQAFAAALASGPEKLASADVQLEARDGDDKPEDRTALVSFQR